MNTKRILCLWGVFLAGTSILCAASPDSGPHSVLPLEARVEKLLGRMTLEEKVAMTAGGDYMDTLQIPRLGIPAIKMTDGPHGVRWNKAVCFPTAIAMGATWNTELIHRVGMALAHETLSHGRNLLLGPCVNIHRIALGGRNFESFGEDPYLAARMAVAYVKGVQRLNVGTSTKHYACNNQEHERTTINAVVGERALREIYLPAFRAAVQEADTWSVMGAYNKVNGDYCCANRYLLTDLLKDEWGFRGFVVSDWNAVHSTAKSAQAGLDLEMPGPGKYFGDPLLRAVQDGSVSESVIDDKVRRILRVIFLEGLMDGSATDVPEISPEEHHRLAREVARQAVVLMKNEHHTLPLDFSAVRSIAVIGPNADKQNLGGGGSSSVNAAHVVTPLQGLRNLCGENISVTFERGGWQPNDIEPVPSDCLFFTNAAGARVPGLQAAYFNNQHLDGAPVMIRTDRMIDFDWEDSGPYAALPENGFSVRWSGQLVPQVTGTYLIGLRSDDGSRMFVDGLMFIDHWDDHGPETATREMNMVAGRAYDICIEHYEKEGGAMMRLGWRAPDDDSLQRARKAARRADAAIIFAGLSSAVEGEGVDRETMDLPDEQEHLIHTVAAANSNTIVVLFGGTSVDMRRWIDGVPALLLAWYPGQAGGEALAEILFGEVNPSGKTPITVPRRIEDTPAFGDYPGFAGEVVYREGLYVGYRYYEKRDVQPMFPFGHGLSYTDFAYQDLHADPAEFTRDETVRVTVTVQNAGTVKGREVVQLYVSDPASSLDRPIKELKGFRDITLAPGESGQVTFELDRSAFSFYDPAQKAWIAEPGEFGIAVGRSSADIRLQGRCRLRAPDAE